MTSAPPELVRVHQEWIEAELRGDVERLLELCTDDVRFLAPGAELLTGKPAVRAFLEAGDSKLLSVETSEVRFEVGEALAFKTCRFATRLALPGGDRREITGSHAWLLRRVEGRWLVGYVTWHCAPIIHERRLPEDGVVES